MKKILLVLSFLFTVSLLTSCIKIDSSYVVGQKGNYNAEMIVDYTKVYEMTDALSQSLNQTDETNTAERPLPCELLEGEDSGFDLDQYEESFCKNLDDFKAKLIVTGGDLTEYYRKEVDNSGKEYLSVDLFESNQQNSSNLSESSPEQVQQSVAMIKAMGLEMNFNYQFEGARIESNFGKVEGNKISFSIYDMLESKGERIKLYYGDDIISGESDLQNKLSIARQQLMKTKIGRKRVSTIDKVLEQLSTKKLTKLSSKLDKLNKKSRGYLKNKHLIDYLEAKTLILLSERK